MKRKTVELSGAALDYAVALAKSSEFKSSGYSSDPILYALPARPNEWRWLGMFGASTGPAGDDIIDREKISVVSGNDLYFPTGNEKGEHYEPLWVARHQGNMTHGTTRREAAMRCYVLSKLGAEVDIPKELCT